MAGNALRCMAKYLYDNGIVRKEEMTIETDKGVKTVQVYTTNGKVTSACVDMGYATAGHHGPAPEHPEKPVVNYPVHHRRAALVHHLRGYGQPPLRGVLPPGGRRGRGASSGPQFEHAPYFPDRINTEFIRVVNPKHHQDAGLGAGQRRDPGLRHRRLRGGGGGQRERRAAGVTTTHLPRPPGRKKHPPLEKILINKEPVVNPQKEKTNPEKKKKRNIRSREHRCRW